MLLQLSKCRAGGQFDRLIERKHGFLVFMVSMGISSITFQKEFIQKSCFIDTYNIINYFVPSPFYHLKELSHLVFFSVYWTVINTF